jgi:hypothetical protein
MPAAPKIRGVVMGPLSVVAVGQSPQSLAEQRQIFDGEAWRLSFVLPPMRRRLAQPYIGFLTSLRGRGGTFLGGDPYHDIPLGTAAGTPVVDGVGQQGDVLLVRGFDPDQSVALMVGDYIQLGAAGSSRLHMVLVDAPSDSFGKAVLEIFPKLRESPGDGATVLTQGARGVFRLERNDPEWARTLGYTSLPISAVEVVE